VVIEVQIPYAPIMESRRRSTLLLALSILGACTLLGGCSSNGGSDADADVDGDSDSDADGDEDTDGDADTRSDAGDTDLDGPIVTDGDVDVEEDGGTWTCHVTICDGHLLECGDCEDNDGDGLIDSHDRECLGPCDNTEGAALTTGVGGETGGPCRADCYFDFGNGPGNDDCHWDSRCDPLAVPPRFDPEDDECRYEAGRVGSRDCPPTQSELCLDTCMPLTPNGCDCFGCCSFPALVGRSGEDGGEFVWLGSHFEGSNEGSCTFDDILDRTLCRPCTPVEACMNPCGPCELCLGREELPPECFDDEPPDGGPGDGGHTEDGGIGPPGPRCPEGIQPCGLPTDPECAPGSYCITGCCQPILI